MLKLKSKFKNLYSIKYFDKLSLVYKVLQNIVENYVFPKDIYYVTENVDWVISDIGNTLALHITKYKFKVVITPFGIRNSIVHYASINTFLGNHRIKLAHKSNKIIVTWFHISDNDLRIKLLPEAISKVSLWHTSCEHTKNKMVILGIPEEKIVVIPLGVDLKIFNNPSEKEKSLLIEQFNLPSKSVVIGSFQKDGNGWGRGLEPKLIKGPDIFCKVVSMLANRYDLYILLTGPSRGYVKRELDNMNVPYNHIFLNEANDVADYYKVIDIYLVTSREEGGPKAILESMASGVPLVSTKVGLAMDIIKDNENGFLVNVEDVETLYTKACEILDNRELSNKLIGNGLKTIENYKWEYVSKLYITKLYRALS